MERDDILHPIKLDKLHLKDTGDRNINSERNLNNPYGSDGAFKDNDIAVSEIAGATSDAKQNIIGREDSDNKRKKEYVSERKEATSVMKQTDKRKETVGERNEDIIEQTNVVDQQMGRVGKNITTKATKEGDSSQDNDGFVVITHEDAKFSDIDAYGFERAEDFNRAEYEQFFSGYLSVLARRASRWGDIVTHRESIARNSKLKRYCRKGIPGEHRSMIWLHVSGAENGWKSNPGLYSKILNSTLDPDLVDTIKADTPRTFPDNIYFKDVRDPQAKQRPLFNVLVCLGTKNDSVGYCQGLNFIAGMLLLVVKDEEKVFWLMDTLINHILPSYYTQTLVGVKADIEVLEDLVRSKMPAVHKVLESNDVSLALVCTKWFICCFADVMPVETLLRIWDCLFYEGSKIIFRVALTLIKRNQEKILKCRNFTDVIDVFKAMPHDPIVTHCHKFMQLIFEDPGSLSKSTVKKLRQQNVEKILAEG